MGGYWLLFLRDGWRVPPPGSRLALQGRETPHTRPMNTASAPGRTGRGRHTLVPASYGRVVSRGSSLTGRWPSVSVSTCAPATRRRWVAGVDQHQLRSLTWDRGSEMAQWENLTAGWGLDVYFCDPHSPWQRGQNEKATGNSASGSRRAATCPATPSSTSTASATFSTPNPAAYSPGRHPTTSTLPTPRTRTWNSPSHTSILVLWFVQANLRHVLESSGSSGGIVNRRLLPRCRLESAVHSANDPLERLKANQPVQQIHEGTATSSRCRPFRPA